MTQLPTGKSSRWLVKGRSRWSMAALLLLGSTLVAQYRSLRRASTHSMHWVISSDETALQRDIDVPLRYNKNSTRLETATLRLQQSTTTTNTNKSDGAFTTNDMEWAEPHLQALYRPHHANNQTWRVEEKCFEECLLRSAVKYYMYPEHLLFSDDLYFISNLTHNDLKGNPSLRPRQYVGDARWEIEILRALQNHSLRTDSHENASLIILPVPFASIFYDEPNRLKTKDLMFGIRSKLYDLLPFQQGKPHVVVSTTFPLFNKHYKRGVGRKLMLLYETLQNAVVASADDRLASNYAYLHNVTPGKDFRGFDETFANFAPMTEHQFSIGLGEEALHLPLVIPTWKKFQNSSFFIFYHSRKSESCCSSTAFRHAPLLNITPGALPRSSIGYEIPLEQWREEYANSKFCLVIRGDSPHSHALFNAVKVGCIPVVISDWYPFYAPPFPTSLEMQDFCIFIPEGEFSIHPEKALQSLQHVPQDTLKKKIVSLKWAQQVMMMDHPRSLFVPAFVREALASFSRRASKLLQVNHTG